VIIFFEAKWVEGIEEENSEFEAKDY
jgi:hypothetical protein